MDLAAWKRSGDGSLVPITEPASWLPDLDPAAPHLGQLIHHFPVLEHFLQDADSFFRADAEGRMPSDVWVQPENDLVMQAWAIRAQGHAYLIIESLGDRHHERIQAIQYARQTSLLAEILERRSKQIEVASRRKSEFLARLSHELRTPLNAIIGFSTLLGEERSGALNERQRKFLNEVLDAGHHLLAVINEILDLSRIEAGVLRLNQEKFQLAEAIEEAVSGSRVLAQQNGVSLSVNLPPDQLEVNADRVRFKQIVINLVNNAVKFTPSPGKVDVTCVQDGNGIRFSVRDTGIGIPEADKPSIFLEFFQASNQRNQQGSGLGLAITKRLVAQHGGTIGFDSKAGRGSEFWFTLPGSFEPVPENHAPGRH